MARGELPRVLRLEESCAGGGDDDEEADEGAQHRRELRTQELRDQQVGDDERDRGEQGERSHGEAGPEAALLTEESGHEAHEDEGDHEAADRVQRGDLGSGVRDERGLLRDAQLRHAVEDRLGVGEGVAGLQSLPDAGEHRGADRAEAHGGRLDDEARQNGGDGGEAQGQQQRGDDRGGSAEAGRALDEAAEQPGDDDDLDPAVGRDRDEARLDRVDRPGFREGRQEQQRSEHDPQQAQGDDDALDHGGADRDPRDAPAEEAHEGRDDEGRGHRHGGGRAEDEQQHARDEDGRRCEERRECDVVHGGSDLSGTGGGRRTAGSHGCVVRATPRFLSRSSLFVVRITVTISQHGLDCVEEWSHSRSERR